MYQFKADIPVMEFTEFIENSSFAPIQQTVEWTKLKNNWKNRFCGIYKDDALIGVALILIRTLMPGFNYAYCPRGPVMDLTDAEAIKAFRDGAKEFCKKNNIYSLKTDPAIVVNKILPDIPTENFFDPFDLERAKIEFDTLVNNGFEHKGFVKNLGEAIQPRFNALIPLKDANGTPLSAAQFKKNYKQKIRKYLGNFQPARGLFYEGAERTPESIALFKKILSNTEERQNISLRSEDYFTLLADAFGDKAFFAFEKCRVNDYIGNLEKRYEKEPDMRDKITEQLEDAKRVLNEKGEIVPLAALLTVYPPNKKGVRIAEYLYSVPWEYKDYKSYEKGFDIFIDGKKTEYFQMYDMFIGIDLPMVLEIICFIVLLISICFCCSVFTAEWMDRIFARGIRKLGKSIYQEIKKIGKEQDFYLFSFSNIIVTGPSLVNLIFISAPNTPVSTLISYCLNSSTKILNISGSLFNILYQ